MTTLLRMATIDDNSYWFYFADSKISLSFNGGRKYAANPINEDEKTRLIDALEGKNGYNYNVTHDGTYFSLIISHPNNDTVSAYTFNNPESVDDFASSLSKKIEMLEIDVKNEMRFTSSDKIFGNISHLDPVFEPTYVKSIATKEKYDATIEKFYVWEQIDEFYEESGNNCFVRGMIEGVTITSDAFKEENQKRESYIHFFPQYSDDIQIIFEPESRKHKMHVYFKGILNLDFSKCEGVERVNDLYYVDRKDYFENRHIFAFPIDSNNHDCGFFKVINDKLYYIYREPHDKVIDKICVGPSLQIKLGSNISIGKDNRFTR